MGSWSDLAVVLVVSLGGSNFSVVVFQMSYCCCGSVVLTWLLLFSDDDCCCGCVVLTWLLLFFRRRTVAVVGWF